MADTPQIKSENIEAGSYAASQPPAYSTERVDEPPPSYESIFSPVKKARDESDGNVDYACKVFGMICCSTVATVIGISLCFAIPLASLIIGAMNLKNCTIERYIPIYLVVAGVFGIIKAILNCVTNVIERKKRRQNGDDDEEEKKKPNPLDQLLNCFLMAWFIAGSVWVYRIYGQVNYDDVTSGQYCDKTTYLFTFAIITMSYCMVGLALLCCCGMSFVMCCVVGAAGAKE